MHDLCQLIPIYNNISRQSDKFVFLHNTDKEGMPSTVFETRTFQIWN